MFWKYFLGGICAILISSPSVWGQTGEKELYNAAKDYMSYGEFDNAEIYFKKLVDKYPDNAQYNMELGILYFLTADRKTQAIPYLEKADQSKKSQEEFAEIYYYLGQCYQIKSEFDKAIDYLTIFKTHVKNNKEGLKLQQEVSRRIESCNHAKIFTKAPIKAEIVNAGENVNGAEFDYAPVVAADQSAMYFTSRRQGNYGEKTFDENHQRMLHNEDIYMAPMSVSDGKATIGKSKKATTVLNTPEHDAAIGVSPDNQKLFLYRDNDLWLSQMAGKSWGKPKRLNNKFNSKKGQETSAAISASQDKIFIVSNRKGGYGGKDIYVSEIQENGDWGPLVNLGPTINTSFDEESPFVSADGKTLYFASQGHSSMGGFDIFSSAWDKDEWLAPKNMGYPLNSTSDDLFFTYNDNGKVGYFSSNREEGLGCLDIYQVYLEETEILVTEIRGIVLTGRERTPQGARITVKNNKDNKVVGYYWSNEDTASTDHGKYLLVLNPGEEYNLLVEAEGFQPYSQDIFVPAEFEYHQMYQEIHLGEGESTMYSALFDIDTQYDNAYSYIEKQLMVDAEYAEYLKKDNMYSAYINTLIKIDKILSDPDVVLNDPNGRKTRQDEKKGAGLDEFFTPDEILAVMIDSMAEKEFTIPNIEFEYDRETLMEDSKLELNKLYTFMKNSDNVKLEIRAHTDNSGDEAHNLRLSQKRAEVVRDYLVSKGIKTARITAKGYGESRPIAPNTYPDGSENPKGMQKNRRIEVKISR